MVEDDAKPVEVKELYPEFDLVPRIPPEQGGELDVVPLAMLNQDAPDDFQLRDKLRRKIVPPVENIIR
jgi:hypothetical protein